MLTKGGVAEFQNSQQKPWIIISRPLPSFPSTFFFKWHHSWIIVYIQIWWKKDGCCSGRHVSLGSLRYFSSQGRPQCLSAEVKPWDTYCLKDSSWILFIPTFLKILWPQNSIFAKRVETSHAPVLHHSSWARITWVSECMKPKRQWVILITCMLCNPLERLVTLCVPPKALL